MHLGGCKLHKWGDVRDFTQMEACCELLVHPHCVYVCLDMLSMWGNVHIFKQLSGEKDEK